MEITLQSLLDEIARDGGDLAALLRQHTEAGELTAEQLTALLGEASTAFQSLRNAPDLNQEGLGQLQTIADAITGLRAESTHLTEQAEATQARAAEIAAQAGLVEDPENGDTDPEGDGAGDGDDAAAGEGGSEAEGADAGGDSEGDGSAAGEGDAAGGTPDAGTAAPQGIAASAGAGGSRTQRRRVSLRDIAPRAPRPGQPSQGGQDGGSPFSGALVAAAGLGSVRAGHQFGAWSELGAVAADMLVPKSQAGLVASAVEAGRQGREFYDKSPLAAMRREYPEDLVILDPNADSKSILDRAADIERVPGGAEALVAATGWCAPSEQTYDLCELPCALEGILSTPEVNAARGGLRYTKGIDFCDIYNAAGYFHYTEAELMATPAPQKPCMEIPCVDFDEVRLEVDGMCIVGDIPQARAYPEVVAQFLQGAVCARAHRTNALKIGRIATGSQNDGAVTFAPMGATASVLNAIDLKIMEYRYRGLRAQDGNAAILEMVVPFWLRGVIRGDLANRNGYDNPFMVTNAQIDQWFASRGVIPRWVYDYQPLPQVCATPAAAPITAWPTTVEVIIYEAGTWVFATQDVISLENVYDSTLIRQNKFTALFVEDAFVPVNRCGGSIRFQIPIVPSGTTGAQMEFGGAVAGLMSAQSTDGSLLFDPSLVANELENQQTGPALPEGTEVTDAPTTDGTDGSTGSTDGTGSTGTTSTTE